MRPKNHSTKELPSLSVTYTNIRSLLPKRDQLCSYLDDSNSDILVLTETWLHSDISDSELFNEKRNYSVYRYDRTHRRGGGVLLAVRNGITSFSVETNASVEITWAACVTASAKVLIGACYRPPDSDPSFLKELRESISCALKQCPADIVYLFGDFNFPLIDWSLLSAPCSTSTEFINLTLDFNLVQVIDEHTRGSNILDLVLTTAPESIGSVSYIDGFSDHKLLQFTFNTPLKFPGAIIKKIRDYNKGNYREMNAELEEFFNESFLPSFSSRSVDDIWVLFKNKIAELVDKHVL